MPNIEELEQDRKVPYIEKIAKIREQYPRAYEPWSAEEDEQLQLRYSQQASIKVLAAEFQRQPGAIQSRLKKLGL